MSTRITGSTLGLSEGRFAFSCASAAIEQIRCAAGDPGGDTILSERTDQKTKAPRKFEVILLNDDFTPFDFVINTLQSIFHMDIAIAVMKTNEIHTKGQAVCGVYTLDIAQTKVDEVISAAQAAQHPLQATYKPA